jgi:hypothetical protein
MTEGALALLDCLGFKGIWDRGVSPELILKFLKEAKSHADNSPTFAAIGFIGTNVKISVVFISDTIAVSIRFVAPPSKPELASGYLVMLAIHLSIELSKRFVAAPVPLMFRGVITYGAHIAEDSFILGPAVDEAATSAETTEGAFIWLSPKSQTYFRSYIDYERTSGAALLGKIEPSYAVPRVDQIVALQAKFQEQTVIPQEVARNRAWWNSLSSDQKRATAPLILENLAQNRGAIQILNDYPMEMKGGGHLHADVVNPLFLVHPDNHADWIGKALSGFTESPVGVLIKRQNTARFLAKASDTAKSILAEQMARQDLIRAKLAEITGVSF